MRRAKTLGVMLSGLVLTTCQSYEYVFQPDANREGAHLKFAVEQPSKADMLFVVDNSLSMRQEQEALAASFGLMLDFLAPLDTSYRIGIVSTDVKGKGITCCGVDIEAISPLPDGSVSVRGGVGNCAPNACQCNVNNTCDGVDIRRPHDGTFGRLMAAYDPEIFNANATKYDGLSVQQRSALAVAFPTGLSTGPDRPAGPSGVPSVIDRDSVRLEACQACLEVACTGVTDCALRCTDEGTEEDAAVLNDCALPVARELIDAYFRSNIRGLGTNGSGYEAGVHAALYAIGIDPGAVGVRASAPNLLGQGLMAPGQPNSFAYVDRDGLNQEGPWVRDNALLAVMFVSDEEECTLSSIADPNTYELEGAICYDEENAAFNLRPLDDLSDLFHARKSRGTELERSSSRLTFGFIGGVEPVGAEGRERRRGRAADCTSINATGPSPACSCMEIKSGELTPEEEAIETAKWCSYTKDTSGEGDACEAMAGDRYVSFANQFTRKTFDSVCQRGDQAFGEALVDFARLATLACFDLADEDGRELRPARCRKSNLERCDPSLITVKRAPREDAEQGIEPSLLPRLDGPDAVDVPETGAWYYNAEDNQVCLLGIDRLIGDVYDIFVLHTDDIDFSR